MSKKMEFVDCEACVDCMLFIANGDVPEDDDSFLERFDGSVMWMNGWANEDTEADDYEEGDGDSLGFSWQSCECCNSHLGGDRFKVCYEVTKEK